MKALTLLGVVMGALMLAAAGVHEEAPDAFVDPAVDQGDSVQDSMQDDEAAVVAAVERLFESMRTNDGEMARSVFHPDARLGRATEDGISFSPADGFIERIGTPKDQVWDEPIWDWNVDVDGRLAQMWTKYAFYLDDAFSHCGVDAIQLYRSESGWQITQLVDTNRQEDCWYPPGRTP
ncbi:MAG: nuclear transport factor 2 family protein [Longimicrobiales bacterium]